MRLELCVKFVLYILLAAITIKAAHLPLHSSSLQERDQNVENKVLDQVIVDLKSKLYPDTSDPYIYKSNSLDNNNVTVSHLHSSQMNSTSLLKYFEIQNKTNIALVSSHATKGVDLVNRRSICLDVKMCNRDVENSNVCLFNVNMIVYMSSKQIKLVKIGVILNDLSDDFIHFEKSNYIFNIDPVISNEIGSVKAMTTKNSDLIKYFVSFKEAKNRAELSDTVFVDEITGRLSLNRTKISNGLLPRRIDFYVDAIVQCSYGQNMLHNQTKVQLNIIDNSHLSLPSLNITYLWETKTLKLGPTCLKLNKTELRLEPNASTEIPIAQIQIDNLLDYDLDMSDASFAIESVEPKLEVNLILRHLVDNIYIIYLEKSTNPVESLFLNDLYRVNLKLTYQETQTILADIYLCVHSVDTDIFPDELNLLQFDSNVIQMDASQVSLNLKARKIGPFKSRIRYFLDSDVGTLSHFDLTPLGNDFVRLSVKPETARSEVLVRELTLVAYDEMRFPNFPGNQYESIRRVAIDNQNRLMHFSTRVKVIYEPETFVNDPAFERIDEIYKFSVLFSELVNNSIIGYLPSLYELHFDASTPATHSEYKIINSNVHPSCFQISKYDGIIYYTPQRKFHKCLTSHYPIKLLVELGPKHTTHVLIYEKSYDPINLVNLQFDEAKLLSSTNLHFEINLNYQWDLNYKLEESLPIANLVPSNMREQSNHRVKFEIKSKTDAFVLDSKRSRLYISKQIIEQQSRIQTSFVENTRCFQLEISRQSYAYLNSTHRKFITPETATQLNVCFYLGRESNRTDMLLIPIEESALTTFETLKSRIRINYVPMVWYFTLAVFSFIFMLLIIFLVYNAYVDQTAKSASTKSAAGHHQSPSNNNFEHFDTKYSNTSKYSSTPSSSYFEDGSNSFERQNALKIRSEHPSIKTDNSYAHDLNQLTSENYGFLVLSNDDRQVPSKLDILLKKQPLSPRIANKIQKENENIEIMSCDHGVYCLATATSFTSNVSSVTNSECVDAEVVAYTHLNEPINYSSRPNCDNKSGLSLFDLTPASIYRSQKEHDSRLRLGINSNFDYTEINQVFNRECII